MMICNAYFELSKDFEFLEKLYNDLAAEGLAHALHSQFELFTVSDPDWSDPFEQRATMLGNEFLAVITDPT